MTLDILDVLSAGPPRTEPRGEQPVVFFHTPWMRPDDGWSIAARAYARCMSVGGLDVRLAGWNDDPAGAPPEVLEEVGHLVRACRRWDLHLFSAPIMAAEYMRPVLANLNLASGARAMHCVFERLELEPKLVEAMNGLTGTWAQCSANLDVMRRSGVRNATLILHPYFDDDPMLALAPPRESKRFYWIGRFEPRKAPENIIRAFLRAFRPGEATLTMKLSPYPHPWAYESPDGVVLNEIDEPEVRANGWDGKSIKRSFRFISGRLTKLEMVGLHAAHDIYVSSSRGEGLDLPCFAAKLAGRRVVTTDSGGPRDFVSDGDEVVPQTGSVPADEHYAWGEGASYADYRLEDLVAAMQRARATTVPGSRVPEKFRAENVAKSFREWVRLLCGF